MQTEIPLGILKVGCLLMVGKSEREDARGLGFPFLRLDRHAMEFPPMTIKGTIDGGLAFGRKRGKPFRRSTIVRLSIKTNDFAPAE